MIISTQHITQPCTHQVPGGAYDQLPDQLLDRTYHIASSYVIIKTLGAVAAALLLQVVHQDSLDRLEDAPQRTALAKDLVHMLLELAHANAGGYSDAQGAGRGGGESWFVRAAGGEEAIVASVIANAALSHSFERRRLHRRWDRRRRGRRRRGQHPRLRARLRGGLPRYCYVLSYSILHCYT